eukprot:CAMPEP_0185262042 /NCGR_PEP_ID=MMETSP1359-20130426/10292_1 /TAXON_ID=552665 /ORGANISM="Bigelowiella longifila, Strain CCMP242" /LENGTH=80 /DNA_ID=CAMNT_0027848859 /DNA_START=52 /DNA_END=294 /DNA_ORIENTATION=+
MAENQAKPKVDLKEIQQAPKLKHVGAPKTNNIDPHTKLTGAIKKVAKTGASLKKVDKPTEGLSEAEKKAYIASKAEKGKK